MSEHELEIKEQLQQLSMGLLDNVEAHKMPTVKLSSGIVVGNFCSPHSFNFETGEVLDSCSSHRVNQLALAFECSRHPWELNPTIMDVEQRFVLTETTAMVLIAESMHAVLHGSPDLILIPRILQLALMEELHYLDWVRMKIINHTQHPTTLNPLSLRILQRTWRRAKFVSSWTAGKQLSNSRTKVCSVKEFIVYTAPTNR